MLWYYKVGYYAQAGRQASSHQLSRRQTGSCTAMDLYLIGSTPNKGLGVFAARPICKDERIFRS
jgi:hypothetical protein